MDVWFKINEKAFAGSDVDDAGNYVNWRVELWEYTNHLRADTKIWRKTFKTKIEAQEFIEARQMELLVCVIKVIRETYDCKRDHPSFPSLKLMYEWSDFN